MARNGFLAMVILIIIMAISFQEGMQIFLIFIHFYIIKTDTLHHTIKDKL